MANEDTALKRKNAAEEGAGGGSTLYRIMLSITQKRFKPESLFFTFSCKKAF